MRAAQTEGRKMTIHYDLKAQSDTYWQETAGRFDEHYEHSVFARAFLQHRTAVLMQVLRLQKDWRLADVGCGSGVQMALLSGLVKDVVGFDYSADMLALAKSRLEAAGVTNAGVKQCDACKLDASDDAFEVVISLGLLDYLERPGEALKEMVRILKPDGVLVFTVPKKPSLFSLLRWGPGLWLRRTFFALPPILTVLSRSELMDLMRGQDLAAEVVRSLWTTMWFVRATCHDKREGADGQCGVDTAKQVDVHSEQTR